MLPMVENYQPKGRSPLADVPEYMNTTCPKCGGEMRIIAFIEDYKIVKKILDHLGIYEFEKKRSPPKIESPPDEFDDFVRDDYIDCDHVC